MSPAASQPSYTDLQLRQAVEWFLRLRSEEALGQEPLQAWVRWMDTDEGHRRAFDAVAATWRDLPDQLADLMPHPRELAEDAYDGEQSVEEWLHNRRTGTAAPGAARRRQKSWLALAASIALFPLVTLFVIQRSSTTISQRGEFQTAKGQQVEVVLKDGSQLSLGPESHLTVDFGTTLRRVDLLAGEAYFQVHKDAHRPFAVRAGNGEITAVGTAFDVRLLADRTAVNVTEGVVRVEAATHGTSGEAPVFRVAAGHELILDRTADRTIVSGSADPHAARRDQWREGILVYHDEPLRDVVSDVARYSSVPVHVADGPVGALRYSGVVHRDSIQEWAAALPESFPVDVVTDHGQLLVIERR